MTYYAGGSERHREEGTLAIVSFRPEEKKDRIREQRTVDMHHHISIVSRSHICPKHEVVVSLFLRIDIWVSVDLPSQVGATSSSVA